MTFNPVIPLGGLQGWRFLDRTLETQKTAFSRSTSLAREEAYFRENIGKARTAEALVADRRLLSFALDAFGLGADVNSRAFVRKVLESATGDGSALANRLADKRYRDFARTFGFADPGGPRTTVGATVDRIVSFWRDERFETAVGDVDPGMRIALNARQEIARIAAAPNTDDGRWLAVLGSAPLREFMQTALGLPRAFGSIDLDQQLVTLRRRAGSLLGQEEISGFAAAGAMDKLLRNYFVRSEAPAAASRSQGAALTLLSQAASRGSLSRLI